MERSADITRLLVSYADGNRDAFNRLLPLVYEPLKRMAHARLRGERPDHTLRTTGLVHEAYLKLVDIDQMEYESRGHFFAMASKVMRRILINYARQRNADKRGGGAPKETLDEAQLLTDDYAETLLDLDDALERMERHHPRQAEAAQHHYFGGLTNEETAEALGISLRSVERDLAFARAWLSKSWG